MRSMGRIVAIGLAVGFALGFAAAEKPPCDLAVEDTPIHWVDVPDAPQTAYEISLTNLLDRPLQLRIYARTPDYLADPGFDYLIEYLDGLGREHLVTLRPGQRIELRLLVRAHECPTAVSMYPVMICAGNEAVEDETYTLTVRGGGRHAMPVEEGGEG